MGQFRDLLLNLWAGTRLALMLPVRRHAFRPSVDQVVILAVLSTLLTLSRYASTPEPDFEFWGYGVGLTFAYLLGTILGACLVARIQRATHSMAAFLTYILSVEPVAFLLSHGFEIMTSDEDYSNPSVSSMICAFGLFVWWTIVIFRAIRLEYFVRQLRAGLLVGVQAVCIVVLTFTVACGEILASGYADFYEASYDSSGDIDIERSYYAQPALIERATQFLRADRPGVVDLYFVGYAGYADQDVFMREVNSVAALFNSRFDTRDRAVALINNPKTVGYVPLANRHNLAAALEHVATKMYTDEDVLFLFLTSHGAPEILTTEFHPFGLNDLSAGDLRQILDRSGIKWRVIVVSACYSGSFIEPLKDDTTLIMTAARADRTSFGCANENEHTYFGEAYFDQQLRQEYSFVKAFEKAKLAIAEREMKEELTPSEPQIYIGAAIQSKLDELELRLRGIRADGTALAN